MNTCFTLLGKSLELQRYPVDLQHQSWQAWDSADEYLIEHFDALGVKHQDKSILIMNDDFGALACWFQGANIQWNNDSFVARQSCIHNLINNQLDQQKIAFSQPLDKL
jgi:23S rRNA (guanine1835-N2)-methyltransferase